MKGLVEANPTQAAAAPVLTTVGSDLPLFAGAAPTSNEQAEGHANGRVAHAVPMLSIESYYTIETLCEWAASLGWSALSGRNSMA